MDIITKGIAKGIWEFFAKLFSDMINEAFKLITETIIKTSNIDQYITVDDYLLYVQVIAGSLLLVKIAWEALKYQSNGALGSNNRSFSTLMLKTLASGAAIYVLPYLVKDVLLPINDELIRIIQKIGVEISDSHFHNVLNLQTNLATLGGMMILISLVLAIGFVILAIAGGIRYIELLICIIFAPIAAVSIANDGEGVQLWFKETICVVFTQSIHIFLLQILIKIMTTVDGIMMAVLSIGAITVMLRGPQVLRSFLYTSGVGAVATGTTTQVTRMAVMKKVMKSSSPVPTP